METSCEEICTKCAKEIQHNEGRYRIWCITYCQECGDKLL